ncbi:hypothetical protein [Virgibacillus ainsalahensis]
MSGGEPLPYELFGIIPWEMKLDGGRENVLEAFLNRSSNQTK